MNERAMIVAIGVLLAVLLTAGAALTQGTPGISWWVVAGGGGTSSGESNITLRDTLGQPISGPSDGGNVTLHAGYWQAPPILAPTATATSPATPTETSTPTETLTPTLTLTPTQTPTQTYTPQPTSPPTDTPTPTGEQSPTPALTLTPTTTPESPSRTLLLPLVLRAYQGVSDEGCSDIIVNGDFSRRWAPRPSLTDYADNPLWPSRPE